jgi:hypothetical protein
MTRALGRFSFLLLFHLILVGSGFACANPAMAEMPDMAGMPNMPAPHDQSSPHKSPIPAQNCTAPASCVSTMAPVSRESAPAHAERVVTVIVTSDRVPAFDPAAPDTPPPRE